MCLDPEAAFAAATALLQAGDHAGAQAGLQQLLARYPSLAEAHANLALALERQGALQAAERAYRDALAIDPMLVQACINFSVLLMRQKQFAESQTLLRRALLVAPDAAAAWSNLGVLLTGIDQEEEAEACLRRAIAIDPAYRKAYFNLGYLLLRRADFSHGWPCLEYRDIEPEPTAAYGPSAPPFWQGQAIGGRSIVILPEGGHGDMIQFCRYAALLKARGAARVTVLCQPALVRLFARLDGIDAVVDLRDGAAIETLLRHTDLQVRLLSLPGLFGTDAASLPAALPYLTPPGRLSAAARARLKTPPGILKAGLVWRGNPRFENDAERSLASPQLLARLADVAGVAFFSLQPPEVAGGGAGLSSVGAAGRPAIDAVALQMTDLGDLLTDFGDTADILAALDLVITVDTAVAHLAGALGVECWVLLPAFRPDWRWLRSGTRSAWYPGVMRLFRQQVAGQWQPVVAAVGTALGERVQRLRHARR